MMQQEASAGGPSGGVPMDLLSQLSESEDQMKRLREKKVCVLANPD